MIQFSFFLLMSVSGRRLLRSVECAEHELLDDFREAQERIEIAEIAGTRLCNEGGSE
jgi:hypothetical protein